MSENSHMIITFKLYTENTHHKNLSVPGQYKTTDLFALSYCRIILVQFYFVIYCKDVLVFYHFLFKV